MSQQAGGDGSSSSARPPTIKGRVPFLIPTSQLRTTCLTDMSSLPGSVTAGEQQQSPAAPSTATPTPSRTTTASTSKPRRRDGKIIRKRGAGGAFVALNHPKPKETIRLLDEDPERIRNPLIDVPPIVVGERAEAVELYTLTNLIFGREDTFPLSYYARVLGFDVPLPSQSKVHEPLDVSNLPLVQEDVQHWKVVPPLGPFADKWWRTLSYRQEDGGGDGLLDYQDPVYRQIVSRKRPFQVEDLKQVRLPYNPTQRKLHQECLDMAKETISADKFSVLDGSGGDFGVLNDTTGDAISYRLHWYHMEKEGAEPVKNSLGLHSATAYLKQTEKELVFFIHQYRVNVPKPKPKEPLASVFRGARATLRRKSSSMGGFDDEDEDSDYDEFTSSFSDGGRNTEAEMDVDGNPVVEVVECAEADNGVTATAVAEPVEEVARGEDANNTSQDSAPHVGSDTAKLGTTAKDETKREEAQPEGTKEEASLTGVVAPKGEGKESPQVGANAEEIAAAKQAGEERKSSVSAGLKEDSSVAMSSPAGDGCSGAPALFSGPVPCTSAASPTAPPSALQTAAKPVEVKKPREAKDGEISDATIVALTALALEHARACDIYYGFVQVPKAVGTLLARTFRMRRIPDVGGDDSSHVVLVVDLTKCSYKYAFMTLNNPDHPPTPPPPTPPMKHRMLVRLPRSYEAKSGRAAGVLNTSTSTRMSSLSADGRPTVAVVGNPLPSCRSVAFGIRVDTGDGSMKPLDAQGAIIAEGKELEHRDDISPMWDVLKTFPMKSASEAIQSSDSDSAEDEILAKLLEAQKELDSTEAGLEPKVRDLLRSALDMRTKFEMDAPKRAQEREIFKDYKLAQERRKEMDAIWQQQRDQDMDAVCDICNDGEVTPDNQILFCEACNVAVHQMCYGIDEVPEGDYYCVACRYFEREKMSAANVIVAGGRTAPKIAPTPLPICCELCPRKQGAFIRSENITTAGKAKSKASSKWVHVLCAKWQGLNFVDEQRREVVEDVSQLKLHYRYTNTTCVICLGNRGAFHKCRAAGCPNNVHVTCARMSGLCEVIHGEDCFGPVADNPWSLLCPDHSSIDPNVEPSGNTGKMTVEQLQLAASEFPPEPYVPPPAPTKPFNKLNGQERRRVLANPAYEAELLEELVTKKIQGVRCEVCDVVEADGKFLTRCSGCNVTFCDSCTTPFDGVGEENRNYKCVACRYKSEHEKTDQTYKEPQCSLCSQKGGWLREAHATPINKKSYWRARPKEYQRTLFSKPFWVHQLCQMWQDKIVLDPETARADCDQVVMTHGMGFILEQNRCGLCGIKKGMKARCEEEDCRAWCEKSKGWTFHVTCARQAGLEVESRMDTQGWYRFYMRCFQHGGNSHNLRARLEDLIEIEKKRAGKNLEHADSRTMTFAHCSRLLNSSILVMQILGWSWRWAEWWVEYNHTWEPLLEPGQKEEQMTKKELRIVESTPTSRCCDARKCRLAAFGAALRNRDFDNVEKGETVMLDRALRAILHTQSLVGPLDKWEIDFFAQWLGFAYRSKSRLLGFGDDKIPVKGEWKLMHEADRTPKFELGKRRLPGGQELPEGEIFETGFTEVDDFLLPERKADGTLFVVPGKKQSAKKKGRKKVAVLQTPPLPLPPPPEKPAPSQATLSTSVRNKLPKKGKLPPEKNRPITPLKLPTDSQDPVRPDLPPPVFTPTGKKIGRPRLNKPRGPDRPKQRYTRKGKLKKGTGIPVSRKSSRSVGSAKSFTEEDDDVYQSDSALGQPSKRARTSTTDADHQVPRKRRSMTPKSYKEPSDSDEVDTDAVSIRPTRRAAPTNLVEAELDIVAEEDTKPSARRGSSRSMKEEGTVRENIRKDTEQEQSLTEAAKAAEPLQADPKHEVVEPEVAPRRSRRSSKELASKVVGRTKRKRKAAPKNLAEPEEALLIADELSDPENPTNPPGTTESVEQKQTEMEAESNGGETVVAKGPISEAGQAGSDVGSGEKKSTGIPRLATARKTEVGQSTVSVACANEAKTETVADAKGSVLTESPRRKRRPSKETKPKVTGRTKRKRKAAPANLAEPEAMMVVVEEGMPPSLQPRAAETVERGDFQARRKVGGRKIGNRVSGVGKAILEPKAHPVMDMDTKETPKSATGTKVGAGKSGVGVKGEVSSPSANDSKTERSSCNSETMGKIKHESTGWKNASGTVEKREMESMETDGKARSGERSMHQVEGKDRVKESQKVEPSPVSQALRTKKNLSTTREDPKEQGAMPNKPPPEEGNTNLTLEVSERSKSDRQIETGTMGARIDRKESQDASGEATQDTPVRKRGVAVAGVVSPTTAASRISTAAVALVSNVAKATAERLWSSASSTSGGKTKALSSEAGSLGKSTKNAERKDATNSKSPKVGPKVSQEKKNDELAQQKSSGKQFAEEHGKSALSDSEKVGVGEGVPNRSRAEEVTPGGNSSDNVLKSPEIEKSAKATDHDTPSTPDTKDKSEKDNELREASRSSKSRGSPRCRSRSKSNYVEHSREAGDEEAVGEASVKGNSAHSSVDDSKLVENTSVDNKPTAKTEPKGRSEKDLQSASPPCSPSKKSHRSRSRSASSSGDQVKKNALTSFQGVETGSMKTGSDMAGKGNPSESALGNAKASEDTDTKNDEKLPPVSDAKEKSERDDGFQQSTSPPSSPSRRSPRSRSRVKHKSSEKPVSPSQRGVTSEARTISEQKRTDDSGQSGRTESASPRGSRKTQLMQEQGDSLKSADGVAKPETSLPKHALLEDTPPKRDTKQSGEEKNDNPTIKSEEEERADTTSTGTQPRPHKLKHALLGTSASVITKSASKVAAQVEKSEASGRPSKRIKGEGTSTKQAAPALAVSSAKQGNDEKAKTKKTCVTSDAVKSSVKEPPKVKEGPNARAREVERKKLAKAVAEPPTTREEEKKVPVNARSKRSKRKSSGGTSKSSVDADAAAKKPRSEEMATKTPPSSRETRASRRISRGRSEEASGSGSKRHSSSRGTAEGSSNRRRSARASNRHNGAEQEAAFTLLGFQNPPSPSRKRKYTTEDIYEDDNDDVPLSQFGASSRPDPFEDADLPEEPEDNMFELVSARRRGRLRGKDEVIRQMFYTGRIRSK